MSTGSAERTGRDHCRQARKRQRNAPGAVEAPHAAPDSDRHTIRI